jgi:hypothetical protein
MIFILTFTLPPITREEAMARFFETGASPRQGSRCSGAGPNWTSVAGRFLLESDDPQALTAFAHQWTDVVELAITPVLEDHALSDVLKRARVQPGRAPSGGEGVPQVARAKADQEPRDGTAPEADQTGEMIAVPPPAGPGGLEGEGEEPGRAGDRR